MQIQNYYHYSFLWKLIVFTVNEHKNICIAGLNRRAGYATEYICFVKQCDSLVWQTEKRRR